MGVVWVVGQMMEVWNYQPEFQRDPPRVGSYREVGVMENCALGRICGCVGRIGAPQARSENVGGWQLLQALGPYH